MTNYKEVILDRFGHHIIRSKLVDATDEEVAVAVTAYKTTGECDHSFIKDIPGHLYDIRVCAVCGAYLGMV